MGQLRFLFSLVVETLKLFVFTPKRMAVSRMKKRNRASTSGRLRRSQRFSAMAIAEEYNLIRRCIFVLAEKHFDELDSRLLLHDLAQMGEALDLQMQRALRFFSPNDSGAECADLVRLGATEAIGCETIG